VAKKQSMKRLESPSRWLWVFSWCWAQNWSWKSGQKVHTACCAFYFLRRL